MIPGGKYAVKRDRKMTGLVISDQSDKAVNLKRGETRRRRVLGEVRLHRDVSREHNAEEELRNDHTARLP